MARDGVYQELSMLAEPTRVRLLHLLEREELGVSELAQIIQVPQPTVSRHLKPLRLEGWVAARSEGTSRLFRLASPPEDLWSYVRANAPPDPEDLRRLEGVLAARTVDSASFFGKVASSWDTVRRQLYGEAFVLPTLLALLPELVIADLGCGSGLTLELLAPGAKQVIGVDREQAMLDAARARTAAFANVDLREGLLSDLPLADDEVDAAVFMLVLHHVADVGAALSEARRISRGSIVVLDMIGHDRTDYRHSMGHQHLGFSEPALTELADAAGLAVQRYTVLPPDPEARGPGLFVAVLG